MDFDNPLPNLAMKQISLNWKLAILSATAVALLSLLPQINFWLKRGSQWNGHYATLHGDEFLYSAYLKALIDGRARRNDPFLATDLENMNLPETTFSIQLVPPFVMSSLARVIHVSPATTFIALAAIAGFLAASSIYLLLVWITNDPRIAAAGSLFILCFGSFAAGQGFLGLMLNRDLLIFGFPFLRRYQPAAAFFLFYLFVALVWKSLRAESDYRARVFSVIAGVTLALLIFSYLYLWTGALAWLITLTLLWIINSRAGTRGRALTVSAIVSAITGLALVPYALLVSNRAHTLDDVQTLIRTHQPDVARISEAIGILSLIGLAIIWRTRRIQRNDPLFLLTASFCLVPLVVFNQQVITGRSMQPFHFEDFVANYSSLLSVVLLVFLAFRPVPSRALVWAASLSILCGIIEVNLPMRAYYEADKAKDEAVPVLLRLSALSEHDQAQEKIASVFSPQSEIMLMLPTWSSQKTLLGIGSLDFGSITQVERKHLFYTYLYYSGIDGERLRELFAGQTDDSFMKYYVRSVTFGHERVLPSLSYHFRPIESGEIESEIADFKAFTETFSPENVMRDQIDYLVTRADKEGSLANIDLWYERSQPERFGDYLLYRLKLRTTEPR